MNLKIPAHAALCDLSDSVRQIDFHHVFLFGILAGTGYMVESNKEHGEGRSDVLVTDPRGGGIAVFEAMYTVVMMLCTSGVGEL